MITFNGNRLSGIGWTVKNLTRPASPTLSIDSYAVSGVNGSIFKSRKIGEREFTVTLQHTAKNKTQLREKINALINVLDVTEPKKLQFNDMSGGYFMAIPTGNWDITERLSYAQIKVTFKALDPFFYMNEPVTTSYTTTSGNVNNTQGRYHNWKVTIQVNKVLSQIKLKIGKTKITLNGSFTAGDTINITDMGAVVYNNLSRPHLLSLDSRIYPLEIGNNAYTITSGAQMWVQIHGKRFY